MGKCEVCHEDKEIVRDKGYVDAEGCIGLCGPCEQRDIEIEARQNPEYN